MKTQRELQAPSGRYVFVAPSPMRVVVKVILLLAVVATAWSGLLAVRDQTTSHLVVASVCALVLVGCWVYLQARIPQRITVDRAIIEIRRDGVTKRYDLEDPGVDIRVRDGQIAFAHYMNNWVLVDAKDVDWKTFTDVVMHYQNHADHNAEARDQRFSR